MLTRSSARAHASRWLVENGPEEMDLLVRAIAYHPSGISLIADNDHNFVEVSAGASKLLGLPREEIIGRSVSDFFEPRVKPPISNLLGADAPKGTLRLVGVNGRARDVEYSFEANVLRGRHLLVLRDKTPAIRGTDNLSQKEPASWVQDLATFLTDVNGRVVAWYSGAERIYGYSTDDAIGKDITFLYPPENNLRVRSLQELATAAGEGRVGSECWHVKKDGSRFWANTITIALRDKVNLHGFGTVVRDFSDRHERDGMLRRGRGRRRPLLEKPSIAGIVSGEFDRMPEANDAFLDLVGYRRADLLGRLRWPDLTPPEYFPLDEFAHEEVLRFGACTPFEKELIRKDGSRIPVLIVTAALKLSPFRWITFVQDLRERDRMASIESYSADQDRDEIAASNEIVKRTLVQVKAVAPTDATVLILGEVGSGKERLARAIHDMSPRSKLPFITVKCANTPSELLERELFGYERGAFAGALSQHIGLLEMAHSGTLFLDEVGDIPLDLKPKLLKVVQDRRFERLGGTREIPIDVRLLAGTKRNLSQMVGDKLFRNDQYYEFKVFPIILAPLRDHPEDIPILVRRFTKEYSAKLNRTIDKIPAETMRALVKWRWPGNVQELKDFIEKSVMLSRGPVLFVPLAELVAEEAGEANGATLAEVEREYVLSVFRETKGVVSVAAARLGIPRTTLNAMMKKLGISRSDL